MVAEEEKTAAVKLVAAAAGDNVDGAAGGDSRREIEVHGADLELLDHLLREILLGAAIHRVVNARAIHRDEGAVGIVAQNRNILGAVVIALIVGRDRHAWGQEG